MWKKTLFFTLLVSLTVSSAVWARQSQGTGKTSSRGKLLNFEDETVEAMNKRPLDSLSQIQEQRKKKNQDHLYRKRTDFQDETLETLKQMRYR